MNNTVLGQQSEVDDFSECDYDKAIYQFWFSIHYMRILLTGASGFVGQHLLATLPEAFSLSPPNQVLDLLDESALNQRVAELSFDAVIHLAAQSFVPAAFSNPKGTFDVNFYGTYNLLTALKKANYSGPFLFISSGDVYGKVGTEALPITESVLPKPANPYSVSKLAAEALCYQWSQTEKMRIVIARPFNHIGPGQKEAFAISGFAKQIAEIQLGMRPPIVKVGDIDVTRDFTDVRDIVRAYYKLLLQGENGEIYNICSGQETQVRGLLEQLIAITKMKIGIEQDVARFRLSDQKRVVGSCQKLHTVTGWQPQMPLSRSLEDLLVYWRNQLI